MLVSSQKNDGRRSLFMNTYSWFETAPEFKMQKSTNPGLWELTINLDMEVKK